MPISVTCPCGNRFRAKDEHAGKTVKCPKCGKGVLIAGPHVAGFDVFLSYSSKDKTTADAACATLEARGLRCWVAPRDILPGKEWGAAIIDGIEQSRSMILVFSANANGSQQVIREVERAVHRGMPIIPFRIEDVPASRNMEYFISCHHWMDAFDGPLEEHLDRLAQTVKALLAGGKPPAPPKPTSRPAAARPVAQGGSRSGRNAVLVLLALLVVGGGGAGGFYAWSKRNEGKTDPEGPRKGTQVTEGGATDTTVANRGTSTRTTNSKLDSTTIDTGTTTTTDQGPKDAVPRKPITQPDIPLPRGDSLPSFREDFSKVKEGEMPAGWTGTDAVSVRKGDGPAHLAVADQGHHAVTLPAFPLPGDFFLELDFHLFLGPHLELTLEGKDGGPDLPVKATASAGGSTGVSALLNVGLADLEPRESTKPAEPEGRFRLRLEREGERFLVKVNGETVHARPVREYKGFGRVRLSLPGGPQTKVYSVAMAQVANRPAGKDEKVDAATAFQKGYVEDFRGTAEGHLPAGWEGDDAVSVMKAGGRGRLEASAKGMHHVTLPRMAMAGNFFCECEFQLMLGPQAELTFQGKESGRDLTVRAAASAGGSTGVAALLNITLADLEPKENTKPAEPEGQFRLRVERDGDLFRVKVNGETVVTRRLAELREFTGIRLGLPGEGQFKFYSIRVGPLPGGG